MHSYLQNECFSNLRQNFLVCTTIHKARHLGVFTGDTLVRVTLDDKHFATKTFPHSENPFYNEYFVFELNCTFNELLRKTILYEVQRHAKCRGYVTLGQLLIDLQSVWSQPKRSFFKKWGQLESPLGKRGKSTGNDDIQLIGYLQIDLAIISDATNADLLVKASESQPKYEWEFDQDYDDISKNLLSSTDTKMECNIRYTVIFYKGVFSKKSEYFIQYIFHPFRGKTKAAKASKNPFFNEFISFTWTYPSMAQKFIIQVCCREQFNQKCLAEYELHFNEIAFRDKPTLGPTFIHLYENTTSSNYVGRLLIEIRSECLAGNEKPRDFSTGKIVPSDEQNWWQYQLFITEFVPLQADFLHGNFGSCKLRMKLAEFSSKSVECSTRPYGSNRKIFTRLRYFKQEDPFKAISISAELPDNRYKYDSDYFLLEIIDFMKNEFEAFKLFQLKHTNQFRMHCRCLRVILQALQNKIRDGVAKKRLQYTNYKDPTPWDTNRLFYLQEFTRTFPEQLRAMNQSLKNTNSYTIEHTIEDVFQQLLTHYKEMSNLLFSTRIQDDWPDLFLILSAGNKDFAVCRVNPRTYLNTPKDKEMSPTNTCWSVRYFIFKDINCRHSCSHCGCISAVVQGCLGIFADHEFENFMKEISGEWNRAESFYYSPIVECTTFKCRFFVYQAKVRPGHDKTGLCDAFARILFNGQSAETPPQHATLSPTWNVVMAFDNVMLPGPYEWYEKHPPLFAIELYDLDKHTSDDYLGCGLHAVSVIREELVDGNRQEILDGGSFLKKFQQMKKLSPPPLKWVPIVVRGVIRAEVLIAAELICIRPNNGNEGREEEPMITIGIPMSIRPIVKNFVLEVVFAGLRNYVKAFTGRHRIKVMMGDLLLTSGLTMSRMRNSINFLVLYASGVVSLPEQLEYWPAIIVTDVIVAGDKNETTIGAMILADSKKYLQRDKFVVCVEKESEPRTTRSKLLLEAKEQQRLARMMKLKFTRCFLWWKPVPKPKKPCLTQLDESDFSWWTKFYNSIQVDTYDFNYCKHSLTIYTKELERYPEFGYLHDWAEPIVLVHGIKFKKSIIPREEIYTTLKIRIKITPCRCEFQNCTEGSTLRPLAAALNPQYQAQIQTLAELCKVIVRVYIVQGIHFRPRDRTTQSDSYVKIRLGAKSQSSRAHYKPNQSNPIFGNCFQIEGMLPRDHLLEVSVYDRNILNDSLIGSTVIDIEDRWRTKHRATVGLANEFCKTGYNAWRDVATPTEILLDLCAKSDIAAPKFVADQVVVDGITFIDETQIAKFEDLHERLSLTVLKNLEKLPSFGYKLIPEHVETRSLYRPNYPGVEQGKIQLWVELYESTVNIPAPLDITPHPPMYFELRVVVLNCTNISRDDKNIFGTRMSDIFVRAWCDDYQHLQTTDIHYRSLNGEASFNWRMIFQLKYSTIEDMMVTTRKGGLLEEYETKQPAVLYLQVWDNDFLSTDDFLGGLEINLANFPQPYENEKDCKESSLENDFGWRPISGKKSFMGNIQDMFPTRKSINLFQEKKVKGWFPLRGSYKRSNNLFNTSVSNFAGKIELEMEMLQQHEAERLPAGLGRSEPNALPPPDRPDTSFNPILNPFKALKTIVLPGLLKYASFLGGAVLAVLFFGILIYNVPTLVLSVFS